MYHLIPCDSHVRKEFVKDLEARGDPKRYLTPLGWFTVATPVDANISNWAIVMGERQEDGKPVFYPASETEGETWPTEFRPAELRKLRCGTAHF